MKRTSTPGIAAVFIVVLALVASCSGGDSGGSSDGTQPSNLSASDPGVVHVHGLGVNPKDGALFAATHTGLFRIVEGKAERVGDRYQDTMGFTIIGPDHFVGSGHPDVRDYTAGKLPGLLGLIETTDAGHKWTPKSLLGKVDFHLLSFAQGQIYGFDSTGGKFMVSKDGKDWDTRSQINLLSFAVSPNQAQFVLGASESGLLVTKDGGRSWGPVSGPLLVLLDWPEPALLFGVDAEGGVDRSGDGGSSWTLQGSLPGPAEAFLATSERLFAAVHEDAIYASDDLGVTWRVWYK